jgi:hypothetical protein
LLPVSQSLRVLLVPQVLQRDVAQDGGVGQVAFVILSRPTARALLDGIWDQKDNVAGQIKDLSVRALRDSI